MRCSRIYLSVLCVAGVALSGCGTLGASSKHPHFASRQPNIRKIAMLPPKVEIMKISFSGPPQQMYELLEPTSKAIMAELRQTLEKRGYEVQPFNLDQATLEANPELAGEIHSVQTAFDQRIKAYPGKWGGKFNYSVGSEINQLADHTDADAFISVTCSAMKKTGGEIAKDFMKSVLVAAASLGNYTVMYSPSAAMLQMGLIDGNTGEILWYTSNIGGQGLNVSKERSLRKNVRNLASRLPKAAVRLANETP